MVSLPTERIKETCTEVLTIFTPTYLKKFGAETVKFHLDAKMKGQNKVQWQLDTRPPAKEWLKEGWVVKRTARGKWAKNWIVLKNAADDYACHYWDKEELKENPDKAKGKIELCGLYCRDMNSDEQEEYGCKVGLTITPWWSRRRKWAFKFEDDQTKERDEWREALQMATRKAPHPLGKDIVLKRSFLAAYRRTRWHFGWVGPYPGCGGSETEHLSSLISDKCERDFMHETYRKIPGFAYGFLHKRVQAALDATVGASVGAGWKAAKSAVDKAKPKIDEKCASSLDEIATLNAKLQETLEQKATDIITPVIAQVLDPFKDKLLTILVDPLVEAFNALLLIWTEKMKDNLDVKTAQDLARWAFSHWQMGKCWKHIHDFCRGTAFKALDAVLHDFSRWRMEDQFEEATQQLIKNAAYTFEKYVGEGQDADTVYGETLQKLVADSRTALLVGIQKLFKTICWEPFRKLVLPKLKALLDPLEDEIPEPVKMVIDPSQIMEKILKNAIMASIDGAVKPAVEPRLSTIKV